MGKLATMLAQSLAQQVHLHILFVSRKDRREAWKSHVSHTKASPSAQLDYMGCNVALSCSYQSAWIHSPFPVHNQVGRQGMMP